MQEKIYIYYTNDLHSSFDHWAQVVGYIKKEKAKRIASGSSCWVVDIGDHIDRVDPIAEAFMGKANVQLMNQANYDIVTLGNNEGITLSHNDLYHLYDEANFEVVCANLHNMKQANPDWLKPIVEIQSVQGVKVGFVGLTAAFNAFYNLLDWHVDYPFRTIEKEIEQLKESTDIIVLLSHLGINEDRQIAEMFSDIDLIIGGHTHHLLRTGETVNETLLTAAGKHCAYVGEVILTWDHTRNKLVKKEAYTTNITHMEKDPETVQTLQKYREKAAIELGEPVIFTKHPIEVHWFKETEIMQTLTDTMKEWTNADVAMLNSGLLLESFAAGEITYRDIHRICPHPINPCVVEVNGDELLEVIRASFTKELMELQLKGFGFRGEVIGRMVFSGLEIETVVYANDQEYVKNVTVQGNPLQGTKQYSLVVADTFTFGRLLPEVAKSPIKDYFLPEFIRDLLAYTLRENFAQ